LLCRVAVPDMAAKMLVNRSQREGQKVATLTRSVREFLYGMDLLSSFGSSVNILAKNLFGDGGKMLVDGKLHGLKGKMQLKPTDLNWIHQLGQAGPGSYQAFLDILKDTLVRELGAVEVVEIPVIFFAPEKVGARAVPVTENMVNMLVLGQNCIFPRPGGPVVSCRVPPLGRLGNSDRMFEVQQGQDVFEQYMIQILRLYDCTGIPIDDANPYHSDGGNVHCGTNTLRRPNLEGPKWWDKDPDDPSGSQGGSPQQF